MLGLTTLFSFLGNQSTPSTPLPTPPPSSEGSKTEELPTSTSSAEQPTGVHGAVIDHRLSDDDVYARKVEETVEREYPQLKDLTYLDHAAAPPPPASLLTAHTQALLATLYSNPHSHSPSSASTSIAIERARAEVLEAMFGVGPGQGSTVEGWELVWTSGATAGLKLVGECFDWSAAEYVYLQEAHTSLVGIRDLASSSGAPARAVSLTELMAGSVRQGRRSRLIGMPLQCNATGRQYLSEVSALKRRTSGSTDTYIVLDAAAYLSGHQPRYDLSQIPYEDAPDFIAFSFYKVFGYPTGLGGLVVKRSAAKALDSKKYFGGGTLDAYTANRMWRAPRGLRQNGDSLSARLEDGTVNYQGIVAIPLGLRTLTDLFGEVSARKRYVRRLTMDLFERCLRMRHANGRPVLEIYSQSYCFARWRDGLPLDFEDPSWDQGATINFNVLTSSGVYVPPTEVDRLACIQGISLREGRHCNSGVITNLVGGTEEAIVKQYEEGYGCDDVGLQSDGLDLTASVRVSLGISSTRRDVNTFISFLDRFFRDRSVDAHGSAGYTSPSNSLMGTYTLSQLVVYPIKSCAGFYVPWDMDWPLTEHGLEHDREWVLVSPSGKIISQKRHPKMTLIRPTIDLNGHTMRIEFGDSSFELDISDNRDGGTCSPDTDQLCGQPTQLQLVKHDELNRLLSAFLGIPCVLARQETSVRYSKLSSVNDPGSTERIPILLSNESPFLMVNTASVDAVSDWIQDDAEALPDGRLPQPANSATFRANVVISPHATSSLPFEEDFVSHIRIGGQLFAALGRCRRCQMVAIDQTTGESTPETFLALAKHRRERGRMFFGQHATWLKAGGTGQAVVRPGMDVELLRYD